MNCSRKACDHAASRYRGAASDSFGGEVEAVRVRGSPDISKRIQASIQRGQKTIRVDVIPTGKKTTPATEPEGEPDLGDPTKPTPEEKAEAIAAYRAMVEPEGEK